MNLMESTCRSVRPIDLRAAAAVKAHLNQKTKPVGSLGRLEDLACSIAAMQGTDQPALNRKAIVIMGADHGVAVEGVSAYPQSVTRQMLLNFVRGGAAINVLARQHGVELILVDMGTVEPPMSDAAAAAAAAPGMISARLGPGTRSFLREAAMGAETALRAVETGIRLARRLADDGVLAIGLGEMGIGNTTSASALASVFTGASPSETTGTGTGIDAAALQRKIEVIETALALHRPNPAEPLEVLAQMGGFEIAGLAGVALGAAARKIPIVADGFISSVAALVAVRLCPLVADYLIVAHRSVEPGHQRVTEALGLEPLLDLNMRLGEGTAAAMAMGLMESSLRILDEMASFTDAQVDIGTSARS